MKSAIAESLEFFKDGSSVALHMCITKEQLERVEKLKKYVKELFSIHENLNLLEEASTEFTKIKTRFIYTGDRLIQETFKALYDEDYEKLNVMINLCGGSNKFTSNRNNWNLLNNEIRIDDDIDELLEHALISIYYVLSQKCFNIDQVFGTNIDEIIENIKIKQRINMYPEIKGLKLEATKSPSSYRVNMTNCIWSQSIASLSLWVGEDVLRFENANRCSNKKLDFPSKMDSLNFITRFNNNLKEFEENYKDELKI